MRQTAAVMVKLNLFSGDKTVIVRWIRTRRPTAEEPSPTTPRKPTSSSLRGCTASAVRSVIIKAGYSYTIFGVSLT